MTENKRFTINDCRVLSDEQVLKILNQLYDENQELKLLLREVEHELTTLTGLTATDSTSIVKEDMEEYGLFKLDYTEMLKKIDKVKE